MPYEDIRLNVNTRFSQEAPAVAALEGGGFVAVWDDGDQDAGFDGFNGVYGRIFDDQGRALTPEFRIPEDQLDQQFSAEVVGLPDGGFVVAWESNGVDRTGRDSDDFNVFFQRFSATGARVGAQRQATPNRDVDQRLDALVSTPDGGFRLVTVASDVRTDWDVYTQRFDDRARPIGGEVLINTDVDTGLAVAFRTLTPGYDIATLTNGGFVAAYWEQPESANGAQVYTQLYDAAGNAVGARTRITVLNGFEENDFPDIVGLADGGYAVAWTREDEDDLDDTDVLVRTFDADGTPRTAALPVNPASTAEQFLGEAVALPGGGFLVTYVDFDRREGSDDLYEARGRVYGADGTPIGDSFGISEFVYEDMAFLGAAVLRDGGVVVAWSGGDLVEEDVFATVLGQGGPADDNFTAVIPGSYRGFAGNDVILGSGGDDTLAGDEGGDGLGGLAGDDLLEGGVGEDALLGGIGRDTLVGGAGADVFLYLDAGESTARERDRIADFGAGDIIGLGDLDADPTRVGDQAFDFVGSARFSRTPGELRYVRGTLSADLDGNGRADFVVTLDGAPTLREADVVL